MAIQGYSLGQAAGLGDMCGNCVEAMEVHLLNGRSVLFPKLLAHCLGFIFSFLLRWPNSRGPLEWAALQKRFTLKAVGGSIEKVTEKGNRGDMDYKGSHVPQW